MDSGTFMLLDAFAYTPATPPATPTGLTATAGDAQATLNWNAAVNATGYTVKRSTNSGGSYTTVADNLQPRILRTPV